MSMDKDVLTGLDRYEEFLKKLEAEILKMDGYRIAIVYSDIKHFKYINDTYGYQRGDMLLKEFVHRVIENNESLLCAARVYSDNIVVARKLPKDMSAEDFRIMVSEINLALEAEFREKYLDRRLKFCTGINILEKDDKDLNAETAVSDANLARKVAKKMDDDCVLLFGRWMVENIEKEVEITSYLSTAIEKGELKVYYQPKIESTSKSIIGAEALVRWQKPDGKFIFPDEFIPLVERSGQIVDVDYFVYKEVFRFIAERLAQGKEVVPISMNVSRVHLHKMDILSYVSSLFEEFQVPPHLVEFEMTESIYIDNTQQALELINGLHKLGTTVSMDDFGSGYSSLNLLSRLPIDVIKMDRVFLKKDELQENDRIIISCVIDMAKKLKMTSLCEGVETLEQSDYLAQIGCEIQQGFYFSKPIPESEFIEFMDNYQIEQAPA